MCDSVQELFDVTEAIEDIICHVARWIYFIDAVDDLEEDLRKGRFNPFVEKAKARKELIINNRKDFIEFAQYTTKRLRTSIKDLDAKKHSSSVVFSVLNVTIPSTSMQIFTNRRQRNKKRYVRLMEGKNVTYE